MNLQWFEAKSALFWWKRLVVGTLLALTLSACAESSDEPAPEVVEMWNNFTDFAREDFCRAWSPESSQRIVDINAEYWYTAYPDETMPREEWSQLFYEAFNYFC